MKIHRPRRTLGALAEAIDTQEPLTRQPKTARKIMNILPKSLHREIARVHRLAQAAGLFMEDRDLLECARCGLLEDVSCYGLLMTYLSGKPPIDSGLRFKKDKRGRYICPNCGAVPRTDKVGKSTAGDGWNIER
jgi:hypothetical protein